MIVGSIELLAVPDAVGLLCEYAEAYPDVPDDEWEPYRDLYPQLFSDASWRLPCTCYVVRSGETTILVDTGVGPPGLWGDWTAEEEGLLPDALDAIGVGRSEIDVVFLTHLHIDHLGWNTDLDAVPLFPQARHVVHADALADVMSRRNEPHIRRCIEPLVGMFDEISGDTEIAAGVLAFTAPGHAPGHMGLRISSDGAEATILADVVPHPAQLDRPDWVFAFDEDPVESAQTRAALVDELGDGDALVVCGHFPGSGIGRLVESGGRVTWAEA